MANRSSMFLFKKGIRPEWEDEANEEGGRWYFCVPLKDKILLDGIWLFLVTALIGNTLDKEDDISGLVVSMREREFRVSLWMKNKINLSLQHSIGKSLKSLLHMKDVCKVKFRVL